MSGDCTQTDSKALHAIWCLSNSQLNSRNLKRIMRASEKTVKSGTKCVLNPSQAEGGRDVRSAGGLSQIHTVIQMAKMLRLLHKQAPYLNMSVLNSQYLLKSTTQDEAEHDKAEDSSLLHKIWT